MTQTTDLQVEFIESNYNKSNMEHPRSQNSDYKNKEEPLLPWKVEPESCNAYNRHGLKEYNMSPQVPHSEGPSDRSISRGHSPESRSDKGSNISTCHSSCSPSTLATEDHDMEASTLSFYSHKIFYCIFQFFGCSYKSKDMEDWKIHFSEHFISQQFQDTLYCPWCKEYFAESTMDKTAWSMILDHIASIHIEILQAMKPEYFTSDIENFIQNSLVKSRDVPEILINEDSNATISASDMNDGYIKSSIPEMEDINKPLVYYGQYEIAESSMNATKGNASEIEVQSSDEDSDSDDEEEYLPEDKEAHMIHIIESLLKMNLEPALEENERQIMQHLMGELHFVIPTSPSSIRSYTTSTNSGSSQGEAARHGKKGRISGSGGSVNQNHNNKQDGNDEGNDNNEDEGREQPQNRFSRQNSLRGPKFACPFFKKEPGKYQGRSGCPGPGWVTVHRLKAHLYTKHMKPEQCPRCWETFNSADELIQHARKPTQCEVRPVNKVDGIDAAQCASLRSKRRTEGIRSEEDKWFRVYGIIFPQETVIPLPYYEPSESRNRTTGSDYFAGSEYNQGISHRIWGILRQNKTIIAEQLIPQILEVIREFNTSIVQEGQTSRLMMPQSMSEQNNSGPALISSTDQNEALSLLRPRSPIVSEQLNLLYDINQFSESGINRQIRHTPGIHLGSVLDSDPTLVPAHALNQAISQGQNVSLPYPTIGSASAGTGSSLGHRRYLSDSTSHSRSPTTSSMTSYSGHQHGFPLQSNPIRSLWRQPLGIENNPNPNLVSYGVPGVPGVPGVGNDQQQPHQEVQQYLPPPSDTYQSAWHSNVQPHTTLYDPRITAPLDHSSYQQGVSSISQAQASYSSSIAYSSGTFDPNCLIILDQTTAEPENRQDNADNSSQNDPRYGNTRKRRFPG